MSLIQRKPLSIGRAQRERRDDRVFVLATEDRYAPEQYFAYLSLPRVKVIVLPTLEDCLSAPEHVVDRLKEAFAAVKKKDEVQTGDEFWVCLDTDHHIKNTHLKGTLAALKTARQVGFDVAMSNPCFEVWLLLHHVEASACGALTNATSVETELKRVLGGYDKTSLQPGMFPLSTVPTAITRARALETSPDDPGDYWPETTGTRIYRILERVLKGTAP